ncbi:hypothetical protein [Kinneretia aquatilis]|uniref:hypothetical protein n=1 Tax=Kinneretia aquatilis TaxID=2070761 RepID=UPI00105727AC|nr:hypothetical protein [Paucibacter aquatile]
MTVEAIWQIISCQVLDFGLTALAAVAALAALAALAAWIIDRQKIESTMTGRYTPPRTRPPSQLRCRRLSLAVAPIAPRSR